MVDEYADPCGVFEPVLWSAVVFDLGKRQFQMNSRYIDRNIYVKISFDFINGSDK